MTRVNRLKGHAAIAGIGVRDGASLMLLDVERLLARIREARP